MLKKLIIAMFVVASFTTVSYAQKNMNRRSKLDQPSKQQKKDVFKIGEHVWVKMKDGSEQESVVHGHYKKNKYYVRKWHSNHQGLVHKKHIRHMSEADIAATKEKYEKKN